jgi:hypothetical protein
MCWRLHVLGHKGQESAGCGSVVRNSCSNRGSGIIIISGISISTFHAAGAVQQQEVQRSSSAEARTSELLTSAHDRFWKGVGAQVMSSAATPWDSGRTLVLRAVAPSSATWGHFDAATS